MFELFVSKNLSGVPVNPGEGGGGVLLRILGGSVLLPGSPNPDPISDHTRFQNWPLGRNYVIIDLSTNKKILRIHFGNVHTLP